MTMHWKGLKRRFNSMETRPLITTTRPQLYTIINSTISLSLSTIKRFHLIQMMLVLFSTEETHIQPSEESNRLIKISTQPSRSCRPMPNSIIQRVWPTKIPSNTTKPLKCSKEPQKFPTIIFQVSIIWDLCNIKVENQQVPCKV